MEIAKKKTGKHTEININKKKKEQIATANPMNMRQRSQLQKKPN